MRQRFHYKEMKLSDLICNDVGEVINDKLCLKSQIMVMSSHTVVKMRTGKVSRERSPHNLCLVRYPKKAKA